MYSGRADTEEDAAAVLAAVAPLRWEWVGDIACVRLQGTAQSSSDAAASAAAASASSLRLFD